MSRYTQTKIHRVFEWISFKNKGQDVIKQARRKEQIPSFGRKYVRLHEQMPQDTYVAPGQLINIKKEFKRQWEKIKKEDSTLLMIK